MNAKALENHAKFCGAYWASSAQLLAKKLTGSSQVTELTMSQSGPTFRRNRVFSHVTFVINWNGDNKCDLGQNDHI